MILGSDSHTRYGALGTMGVGEGGPELVKQILGDAWEIKTPRTVLVWLKGAPSKGVGPHDVAIALCGAVYKNNFVKNSVLEFAGPGVASLDIDYRIGIDVMTTETACLTSIWETDDEVKNFYSVHGRAAEYKKLSVSEGAVYDALIEIDLSLLKPMAALPFHPSEAVEIDELLANPGDILREVEKRAHDITGGKVPFSLVDKIENGNIRVQQGVIAGCAGGMYSNIAEAASILDGKGIGDGEFELTVYPSSIPVDSELTKNGIREKLVASGAVMKTCFCGPCFGAGDVPANGTLSVRHTTRNFPNREGSKPSDRQLSAVILMDARSIAATAANGGIITPADKVDYDAPKPVCREYVRIAYDNRVYNGVGKPDASHELRYGPNIVPWPEIEPLKENILLSFTSILHDPVTTTDELIPSGETSSYRSNPMRLAEFTLSRRDPEYVSRAKKIAALDKSCKAGEVSKEIEEVLSLCGEKYCKENIAIASTIFAEKPGDGSAREQAASCQRVLGAGANVCREFATKRYRSNCINWGMLPFTLPEGADAEFSIGDWLYVPGIRSAVTEGREQVVAKLVSNGKVTDITLCLAGLSSEERDILLAGCLVNTYKMRRQNAI
jgi:aconitate hydratase